MNLLGDFLNGIPRRIYDGLKLSLFHECFTDILGLLQLTLDICRLGYRIYYWDVQMLGLK